MNDSASRHLRTDRRGMLRSAALTAVSGGLLAASPPSAPNAQSASRRGGRHTADFVQTEDGTRLAYKDWGDGSPVVFLHAWALPSQMWDYQLAPLCEQGLRCIAYDRRGHGCSSLPASDTMPTPWRMIWRPSWNNSICTMSRSLAIPSPAARSSAI